MYRRDAPLFICEEPDLGRSIVHVKILIVCLKASWKFDL